MPTGRVKWYEKDKGFGFLTSDDGGDVFVHKAALPSGVEELRAGQRVEFGVVDSRKGAQALSLKLIEREGELTPERQGTGWTAWTDDIAPGAVEPELLGPGRRLGIEQGLDGGSRAAVGRDRLELVEILEVGDRG